jgi:prepilin signal peptidase PulO-like enzyme (type II secretory pathway)
VLVGSLLGAVTGTAVSVLGGRDRSVGVIPFGPFLALGAFVWLFAGPELMLAYEGWLLRLAGR